MTHDEIKTAIVLLLGYPPKNGSIPAYAPRPMEDSKILMEYLTQEAKYGAWRTSVYDFCDAQGLPGVETDWIIKQLTEFAQ
jgi:hypothetical protein